jgi:hypothetical protein
MAIALFRDGESITFRRFRTINHWMKINLHNCRN